IHQEVDAAHGMEKQPQCEERIIALITGDPETPSAIFALVSSSKGVTTAAIPTPETPPTTTPANGMAIISNLVLPVILLPIQIAMAAAKTALMGWPVVSSQAPLAFNVKALAPTVDAAIALNMTSVFPPNC